MIQPDPIPVYAGDDWSFAFSYREGSGNGEPVDLTRQTIVGQLFTPFAAAPLTLTMEGGQAGLIDGSAGRFGIGLTRDLTSGFQPTRVPGTTTLSLALETDGMRRTIAAWPLLLLHKRSAPPPPLVNLWSVDPINGRVLQFDGLTSLVPVLVGGLLGFDFSQPADFISQGL